MKSKNRIVSLALSLVLVLGIIVIPEGMTVQAADVEIQAGMPSIVVGTTGNSNPTQIGFGGRKWDVIGYDGAGVYSEADTITLLLTSGQPSTFTIYGADNKYTSSLLRAELETQANAITDSREQDLILPRDLEGGAVYLDGSDNVAGPAVNGARLWPLSYVAATKIDNNVRVFSGASWWLCSPTDMTTNMAFVTQNGEPNIGYLHITSSAPARPAVQLDMSSVLFTSAASGTSGKTLATVSGGFVSATAPTSAIKLTVLDSNTSNLNITSATANKTLVKAGDAVDITFSGAQTSANKYVSCVLVNNSGTTTHYAKLSTSGGGTANITIPSAADLPNGSYTLRVFNEEVRGDNFTDYASTSIDIGLTVDVEQPTVVAISPTGTSEPTAGNIAVTFSEAMGTGIGVISLNGTALATGTLVGNIYTAPYSGLTYDTDYVVTVSGFRDVAGNEMIADSGSSFRTMIEPLNPTVTPTTLSMAEGEIGAFSVVLGQGASKADKVNIASSDTAVATVGVTTLTANGIVNVTSVSPGNATITLGFSGGSFDGTTETVSVTVTEKTVTLETYAVTFDLAGGTHTGGGALVQSVEKDSAATLPTATREGYDFTGWDKDCSCVTADITITAQWEKSGTPTPPIVPPVNPPVTSTTSGSSSGGTSKADMNYVASSAGAYTKAQFDKDFAVAVKALAPDQTAVVIRGINYSTIDKTVLDHAYKTTQAKGLTLTFHFDEVVNKAVVTRLYLSPAKENTSVTIKNSEKQAAKITSLFGKHFKNEVYVLSYESPTTVTVATKLPKTIKAENLVVYSYNVETNTYKDITANSSVDANGYVHFTTPLGNIVLSEGKL